MVQEKPVFALITDGEGDVWATATEAISKDFGIGIIVAQIGGKCPYKNYDDCWNALKGFQTGGAILVLPDNMIAWRSIYKSRHDGKELEDALGRLLFPGTYENSLDNIDSHSKSRL